MLKEIFVGHASRTSGDRHTIDSYWEEIAGSYGSKGRHYHGLQHLRFIFEQLEPYRCAIHDLDAVVFAVFYHDIVYNVLKTNNEEKSAAVAVARLSGLHVAGTTIEKCKRLILATKSHSGGDDSDMDYFVDADLAILGSEWDSYLMYAQQVRKEFGVFPDFVFKPGRKKILRYFLGQVRIFKSADFFDRYEEQARDNLQRELDYWNE